MAQCFVELLAELPYKLILGFVLSPLSSLVAQSAGYIRQLNDQNKFYTNLNECREYTAYAPHGQLVGRFRMNCQMIHMTYQASALNLGNISFLIKTTYKSLYFMVY